MRQPSSTTQISIPFKHVCLDKSSERYGAKEVHKSLWTILEHFDQHSSPGKLQ